MLPQNIYLIHIHRQAGPYRRTPHGVCLMGVYPMGVQINTGTFDRRRGSRAPVKLQGASEVLRGRHSYVR